MSLLLHYKFDTSDPTIDSSGNSSNLTNSGDAISTTDPTYGTVVSFDGSLNSYLTLPITPTEIQGNSTRTVSYWANRSSLVQSSPFNYGLGNDTRFGGYFYPNNATLYRHIASPSTSVEDANGSFDVGDWNNLTVTHDGSTLVLYVNGVFKDSETTTLNTSSDELTIGRNNTWPSPTLNFEGSLLDFRIYDDALDASTVAQIFANGPNDLNVMTLTPFTHLVDIDWNGVSGATTYHLTYIKDGGSEESLATTTDLSFVARNLVPGSSYEFRVYSDLDLVTAFNTGTTSTPSVDATSVGTLLTRLGNDLTLLSEASLADIDPLLGTVLTTGDIVITDIGSTTFVKNSEILTLPDLYKSQVLTSFYQGAGAGQTVSIILPDTSTGVVSYDETLDEIVVGGMSYAIGTSFVLGGQKVTPKDI